MFCEERGLNMQRGKRRLLKCLEDYSGYEYSDKLKKEKLLVKSHPCFVKVVKLFYHYSKRILPPKHLKITQKEKF